MSGWARLLSCVSSKVTYPDLQSALTARDSLISKLGKPMLAYKCYTYCQYWHITSNYERYIKNNRVKKWNGLDTETGRQKYEARIKGES